MIMYNMPISGSCQAFHLQEELRSTLSLVALPSSTVTPRMRWAHHHRVPAVTMARRVAGYL